MPALSISLLGPFEGTLGGQPLAHFRTRSVQALLVYLVVEREGRYPQQREALTELLWPGMPPESGRKNLRQSLYELRQVIPEVAGRTGNSVVPFLLSDRETIQVNPEAVYELDVVLFSQLVERKGLEDLETAAELYRGDFLSDFYLPESGEFEAWVAGKRAYYRRQTLQALERLTEQTLRAQDYTRAEKYAWQQLEVDDLRENGVRQLMVALARKGERSAALAQYESFRTRLFEALGAEPGKETVSLYEQIKTGTLEVEEVPTPLQEPPSTPAFGRGAVETGIEEAAPESREVPNNLPGEITPFVGREEELEEVTRRLVADPSSRLLTLLGPGGIGKTRLALQVARMLVENQEHVFSDGIWFVSFPSMQAIVDALGLCFYSGPDQHPRQQLLDYLERRNILFLLDAFEEMINEDNLRLLGDILGVAPGVKFLISSRIRLNVHGEQLYPISGLNVPGEEPIEEMTIDNVKNYSALKLFVQSAGLVRPDFTFTKTNLHSIIRICQLVQGMPLGIELAATWVELLSTAEIETEIERGLDFLESGWQNVPEGQQSLRAVFNSSWKMLSMAEREILMKLSIFRGGFTRQAAEEVAGAGVRNLLGLVNKSWLVRETRGRYQIHDMLRQYGEEKLQLDGAFWERSRSAHSSYYGALVEDLGEQMKGADQDAAFDVCVLEFENIRVAWKFLLEGGRFSILIEKMLLGLYFFASARDRGRDFLPLVQELRLALAGSPGQETNLYYEPILETAETEFIKGYKTIRFMYELPRLFSQFVKKRVENVWSAFSAMPVKEVPGLWQILNASMYAWVVDFKEGVQRLEELVEYYRSRGDRWSQAFTMQNMGVLMDSGRVFSRREITRNSRGRGLTYVELETTLQDSEKAREVLSEAAALFGEIGNGWERAHTLRYLGLSLMYDDFGEAVSVLRESQELFEKVRDWFYAGQIILELARLSVWGGNLEEGLELFQQVVEIYSRLGNRHFVAVIRGWESLEVLRHGDTGYARRIRQEALAINREVGDSYSAAWSLFELGEIDRVEGDLGAAQEYYNEALTMFEHQDNQLGIAFYYRGLGDIALTEGDSKIAWGYYQKSLKIAREEGHNWSEITALCRLGLASVGRKDYVMAQSILLEALQFARLVSHPDLVLIALAGMTSLFMATGQAEKAVTLGVFVQSHVLTWRETRDQVGKILARATAVLDPDEAVSLQEWGCKLSLKEAIAMVQEIQEGD